MTRKLVLGLVIIPLGLALIALAVVNRGPAELILDPFGGDQGYMVEAPLFLFLLCAFALGLLIGRPGGKVAIQIAGGLIALGGLGFLFGII